MVVAVFVTMPNPKPEEHQFTFNMDYYLNQHIPLVKKHWEPLGLVKISVLRFPSNDPSGLYMMNEMHWESIDHWEKAFAMMIPEVMNDMPNFTDWPGPIKWWIGDIKLIA